MKNSLILLVVLFCNSTFCSAQPPVVYFNFLSHNEETASWDNVNYYNINRTKLMAIANYFAANQITWNMQSDWRYLKNAIINEVPPLINNTNNKSILRWMYEDKGVEMDPHAHESVYLYPDVAKLLDSIGLPESKIMGGSIYNDTNGINIWTSLINGQYGAVYPNHFWEPSYMMGGGTPNHVADLKYYGFWNPQSPSNYLTHDTSTHLIHFGVGCPFKIRDTTNVANFIAGIRDVVQKVKTGQYPSNGFYFQSIFFGQGDLGNPALYSKIFEVADSLNVIVASGDAQWKTMKQTYTLWETIYQRQMFQWDCGQLVNDIDDNHENEKSIRIYPNPVTEFLHIVNIQNKYPVQIMDVAGKIRIEKNTTDNGLNLDVSRLGNGFYLLRNGNSVLKFIKE